MRWCRELFVVLAVTMPLLLLCVCAPSSAETPSAEPSAQPAAPVPPSSGIDSGPISTPTDPSTSAAPPDFAARIAALVEKLPQPAGTLDSLAGEVAIARAVNDLPMDVRRQALRRALQQFITSHFVAQKHRYTLRDDASLPFSPAPPSDESLDALRRQAASLRGELGGAPLERGLYEVLGQPGAAEVLLALAQGVSSAPAGESVGAADAAMPPDLAPYFQRDANGKLHIADAQRDAATRHLEQLRPILLAADESARRLEALAQRVEADSAAARRYQAALRDPLLANVIALKLVEASVSPADVPQAAEQEARKALQERGGRLRLSDPNSPQLAEVLNTIEKLRSRAAEEKKALAALAQRIGGDDPLHAGYRRLLSSDLAALTSTVRAMQGGGAVAGKGAAATALAQTPLSDVLVQRGGKLGVTRWRRGITAWVTEKVRSVLRDGELIRADLDDFISKLDTPELKQSLQSPGGRWKLISALSQMTDARPGLRLDAWADATAQSPDVVRRLTEQAKVIEQQLGNEERPLVIDLHQGKFETDRLSLLEASIFLNPRTATGRQIYLTEFPRHHAARLWGAFEWDAHESTDLESFLTRLKSRREEVALLARMHQKLMVILSFTPSWLSRSGESRSVEGHWEYRNAVRPKDWATWERMVSEAVSFFSQFDGVQWYFEVWNEPDLPYWQEGTEEYLELYARTVRTVKKAAPNAKVGGAAVNHWRGKPQASKSREPLNVDLIRYAARNSLPLDFVSWHVFGSQEPEVEQAVQRYSEVFREVGLDSHPPELMVTEWNVDASRGTERAAGAFAEKMLTFYRNPIAEEFFSAWEEFNASAPADDMVGPWGMITQHGRKKPEYHVFKLFDELARGSKGVAVFRSADDTARALVSRTGQSGEYDMLVWETGFPPGVMDAVTALEQQGVGLQVIDSYQTLGALQEALRTAQPMERAHVKAFEKARQAYERAARPNLIHLEFTGASGIDVLEAKRVDIALEPFEAVFTRGNALVAEVPRMNVLWLKIRARQ